jgi:hypothetical protein
MPAGLRSASPAVASASVDVHALVVAPQRPRRRGVARGRVPTDVTQQLNIIHCHMNSIAIS